jgi:hypothetical protein
VVYFPPHFTNPLATGLAKHSPLQGNTPSLSRIRLTPLVACGFSFLFLIFCGTGISHAVNISVNLVAPGEGFGNNIRQADGSALPANALFRIGTFVQDPDTNTMAIKALLVAGSAVSNLNNSANFLTFGTASRSSFDPDGKLIFDFNLGNDLRGRPIFLVAYNHADAAAATQVGVFRFYDDAGVPTVFDDSTFDGQIFPTLLLESDEEAAFAAPFFGRITSGGPLSSTIFLASNAAGLGITSANPPDAVRNEPYSYTITANNGATSFSADGLPPGLSVNASTGVISGTPTSSGTSNITLRANNPLFVEVTRDVTLAVNEPVGLPPVITPPGAQTAYRGVPFSLTVAASNDPTSFSLTGAPAGFSISATGVITGTTAAAAGTYNLSVQASNAGGTSAPETIPLTLTQPSVTPSAASVNGKVGTAITPVTISVTPPAASPTFIKSSGPDGLVINSVTGQITGTPTAVPTGPAATMNITATFSGGVTAETKVVFTISTPAPVLLAPAPAALETTRGQEFTLVLERALNGAQGPITYRQVAGDNLVKLGINLFQSNSIGTLSGKPKQLGIFSASFVAMNASGTSNVLPLTITVDAAAPLITGESSRGGGVGLPFRHAFTSNDRSHHKSVSGLPPGLSFARNVTVDNRVFDLISGVPTAAGIFSVQLTARTTKRDGTSLSTSRVLTLRIDGNRPDAGSMGIRPGTFRLNQPTRTTYAPSEGFFLTGADLGSDSTVFMNATGLPPGLGFGKVWNGAAYVDGTAAQMREARRRGLITGTPTQAGTFPITLYIQNGRGYTKSNLTLTVSP